MKFFLFFLIVCFVGGMAKPDASNARLSWALAGFSVLIMLGYFFFDLI